MTQTFGGPRVEYCGLDIVFSKKSCVLKTWFPAGGILGSSGNLRKWDLDGGSRSMAA
jgi:hypothetical protein